MRIVELIRFLGENFFLYVLGRFFESKLNSVADSV